MADFTVPNYGDLIDNLNTQIASGPPKFDFSQLATIPKSYWEGIAQASEQAKRDVFKNGIPKDDKGNIDIGTVADKLARVQGAAAGPEIMNYAKLLYNQQQDALTNPGAAPNNAQPAVAPTTAAPAPSAPAVRPTGASANAPSSLVSVIGAAGIPDEAAGPVITSLARQLGTDPNAPLDLNDPRVRNVLVPGLQMAKKQLGIPDQPQGSQQPAPAAPAAQPASPAAAPSFDSRFSAATAPAEDPTLGGLVPPGRTADQQRALLQRAINGGMLSPDNVKSYQAQIDAINKALEQYRGGVVKNNELTPEQKNANASGVKGGPLALDTLKETYKQDADAYTKQYTGIQTAGQNAITGTQKAQMLKNATLDPNFYSGPLSDYVKTYRQFQSVFGSDPGKAAPAELFTKVANDMLQEQIKAMGQSGVGRVLQAEVGIMKQALASMGNTPLSNRALAEIVMRTYQHNQAIAEITRDIPQVPGKMSQTLNRKAQDYLKAHPLFTPEELQHPQILGAPDAPPQSAQWSPQQKQQWARSVGLKSGDPVRFNGQVVSVP